MDKELLPRRENGRRGTVHRRRPSEAQGIEAEIPEQTAKRFVRNWSGKPGPAAKRQDAPKKEGVCT